MIHALSDGGRRALRHAASQPLLYAFDFDGTLAPISSDRHAVTVSAGMLHWLGELGKHVPCAIVSGRALADVAGRINGYVPYVLGNHGIEGPLTARSRLLEAERTCVDWRNQLLGSLDSLNLPGVEIEDKRYSLTVHLRRAANPATAGARALIALKQLTPAPELIEGKYSINVLPPGQGGKGQAAFALMHHLGRTGLFYIGDEETDETVFSLPNAVTMGVRVGRQEGSRAQFYLDHQAEVEQLLRLLVQCIGSSLGDSA
ncbi:MAG TPA: trehalose-phosphatase [Nitrospira sp.]|nr:trehalose-phosphatase [Nitrospira sp.]